MSTLQAFLVTGVLGLACVGYGSMILASAGLRELIDSTFQRLWLCFILGFGLIGWIVFFPGVVGLFRAELFWLISAIGVLFLWIQRSFFQDLCEFSRPSRLEFALFAVLAIVLSLDLLEGLSPPADADTLAYHFALPRDFLAEGQIGFVARAVSGAIPMIVHMTYAAALAMGGEVALTLWTTLTGWVTGFLLYALVRPYMSRTWALALLIAFLTTPAVLYGGGNGQVEIRCAAFALACAYCLVLARQQNNYRLFALAGVCAGYFVGAKFFGLAFAGAAGLFVLFSPKGVRRAAIFGIAALCMGFQWYLWNWLHTGDPVFPMLTNLLQFPDSDIWTREYGAYFSETMARAELPLDRTLLNWLLYPVYATFNLVQAIEGGRTGLGILGPLLLPLALAGIWRREFRRPEFILPLLIAIVFFTVWFFSGTAQRTRHLLPIYPLVVVGLFPIATMCARQLKCELPLAFGVGAMLAVQMAGQIVFSFNYVQYVLSAETRTQFLLRNVPGANSAGWLNRNLPDGSKVAFMNRQLAYLIERPAFSMHPHIQAVIESRFTMGDDKRFFRQVRSQKVTHLLLSSTVYDPAPPLRDAYAFQSLIGRSIASGCLMPVVRIETVGIRSRTLSQFGDATSKSNDTVFAVDFEKCPG